MDILLKTQKAKIKQFQTFISNYNKKGAATSYNYIQTRITGFKELWDKFLEIDSEIQIQADDPSSKEFLNSSYFTENHYEFVESQYYDYSEIFASESQRLNPNRGRITSHATPSSAVHIESNRESINIKLPTIYPTKFFGDYQKWPTFYNEFVDIIHTRDDISKVQKFHYLRSYLGGAAEQLVSHFHLSAENYDSAWELLRKRYNNERLLVNRELKALMSQPNVTADSHSQIRRLIDTTESCLHSLKNLKVKVEYWDPIVIYIVVKKLTPEVQQLWELSLGDSMENPSYEKLKTFLNTRCLALDTVTNSDRKDGRSFEKKEFHYKTRGSQSFHISEQFVCPLCSTSHSIKNCSKFLALDIQSRVKFIRENFMCNNCLAQFHQANNCTSTFKCRHCDKSHHTLLHFSNNNYQRTQHHNPFRTSNNYSQPATSQPRNNQNSSESQNTNPARVLTQIIETNCKPTLLATALVKVHTSSGEHILRALLDQGSEVSFITESAVQRLKLKKVRTNVHIVGLDKSDCGISHNMVIFNIKSLHDSDYTLTMEALVRSRITDLIPSKQIKRKNIDHIKFLQLADPNYCTPGNIDLLLGARVYSKILLEGVIQSTFGPTAQKTSLGWILSGSTSDREDDKTPENKPQTLNSFTIQCSPNAILENQLKKFFEQEEMSTQRRYSKEETLCESSYEKTTIRNPDGRYVVRLPFNVESKKQLGNSRAMALKRFYHLENKLSQNPTLSQKYKECITEYLTLSQMEVVTDVNSKSNSLHYYLPHHAVVKESSSTTKLRVVFDASAKSSTGISLNEKLLNGPVLQQDIISILIRWRSYKYAFTADIKQMYRQILVNNEDCNFQRIIWRNSENEPLKDYKLKTVTFGTKSAPYLAIRTLHQLAKDEERNYPNAAVVVCRDFYVDDVLSGANSLQDVLELQTQLKELLSSGGFDLRKWVCNHETMLLNVPVCDRELNLPLNIDKDDSVKALGIFWHPAADFFNYNFTLDCSTHASTKRLILSEIAKLFDPLGWISPLIVKAKIIMQKLWIYGLEWDKQAPHELVVEWTNFKRDFVNLQKIKIPRWINYSESILSVQLHGFSDASDKAFSAVVYIRIEDRTGINVHLLTSKTRVAPIKKLTLPRLELSGATLLAKLMSRVKQSLCFIETQIFTWTDSMIVLDWLKGDPNRWKVFVANRITEIHELVDLTSWHHVPSESNPADCASRGMSTSELVNHTLWWQGPDWLRYHQSLWPKTKLIPSVNLEVKTQKIFVQFQKYNILDHLVERCSTFTKIVRVTAYCKKFLTQLKSKIFQKHTQKIQNIINTNHLSAIQLKEALLFLIRQVQMHEFSDEISKLQEHKPVNVCSRVLSLNPFIDGSGLLRVGGRLSKSEICFDERHPIILPNKHKFVELLIIKSHLELLHGGTQLIMSFLRKKYWILTCRNTIRHVIHKCIVCYRFRAEVNNQLMGELPAERTQIAKPFFNTGLDYAGPLDIRVSKGRGTKSYKGYIAIFICFSSRAIHIEAVSDLTSEAFIAAFKRFCSRRGICQKLFSDCGKNFVGASKILQIDKQKACQEIHGTIIEHLVSVGAQWNFIPPGSPHFGGLWEAGVKSIKFHLKRILGNSTLTYEELSTVLCQIEAALNSRPLTQLSDDPNDFTALTPGHFLTGDALVNPPEPTLSDVNMNHLSRWKLLQYLQQQFWHRWSQEYLARLQQRPKWKVSKRNFKVNDLVLLKDERLPPLQWSMGRIINVHPGTDDLVRVVTVRTATGTYKRPVAKVCLLPIEDNGNVEQ